MPALSLDHWNVYCKDLKATVRFYERYVGLKDGDRPPFNFPGAWLYAGDKPILHLVSETGRKDHGSGAIDHVAINCANIRGTIDQLKKDKMPFEVRKVPARPLQQVFVHDPDGVMIELNFWHEADVPEIDKSDTLPGARSLRWGRATPVARSSWWSTKSRDWSRARPARHATFQTCTALS
jgi:catechol 2,3-dioxygenase-like lactoylglutathione lyase family enzyme